MGTIDVKIKENVLTGAMRQYIDKFSFRQYATGTVRKFFL